MSTYYPPSGFYFKVNVGMNRDESSFQEVEGISMELETEKDIEIGGINNRSFDLPKRYKFSNLILKRGLVVMSSPLAKWIFDGMEAGFFKAVDKRDVYVKMVNPKDPGRLLASWQFYNSYPVKWNISKLDAMSSQIVTESIELTYSHFRFFPVGY